MNKVRNFLIPFSFCLLISMTLYPNYVIDYSDYSTEGLELDYNTQAQVVSYPRPNTYQFTLDLGKSLHGFKEAIGFKESRGDYFTVNTLGYLGKYQFGASTLSLLNVRNTNYFLKTPELQEKAFMANLSRNKWILRKDIQRFSGKKISGITITESGILSAAHLAGAGSVKKYLRSYGRTNVSDAYGSTVKYYMKKFSGYDTSSIVPNRKAKVVID